MAARGAAPLFEWVEEVTQLGVRKQTVFQGPRADVSELGLPLCIASLSPLCFSVWKVFTPHDELLSIFKT